MTHRGPRGDSWNKVSVGERIGRMLRIYQSHKGLSLFSENSLERLGVRGSTSAAHSQRAQKKNDKHTYLYFTHTPRVGMRVEEGMIKQLKPNVYD